MSDEACTAQRSYTTNDGIEGDYSDILVAMSCPKNFQILDVASGKNVFESRSMSIQNNGNIKNFFMSNPLSLLVQFEDLSLHMIESDSGRQMGQY